MATTPENWEAIKALFEAALEQDSARRASFLEEQCSDPGLRAEVERLLMEHDQAGAFLSAPALGIFSGNTEASTRILSHAELLAGRFRILRFIASGGMGEVYEAEDQELRERVAVKIIRPDILAQPNAVARFKREVHLARKVTHPNVCRIFDLFRHRPEGVAPPDEIVFISMELLDGRTLASRLRMTGKMSEAEALPLIRQMASALAAAHAVGIVHRDFKPGNVVLVGTERQEQEKVRAVVTDFGLAMQTLLSDEGVSLSTGQGIVGTPAYMSPEQLEGRPATAASDIYAFGLVIYEMVAGSQPFQGDTPMSAALKRLSEPPLPPRKFQPGLSPAWEAAILRCLERDPAKRFSSAEEVVPAIAGASEPPTSGIPSRKGVTWQIAGVLAVLLCASIGIGYALRRTKTRVKSTTYPSVHLRRSVAVLGFKNLSGRSDKAYISTTLSEETTSELAAGGQFRAVPGETVAQMKVSLALPDEISYGASTLRKIRRNVGCDNVVVGSYLVLGNGRVRVDMNLEDASTGELMDSVIEDGDEGQLDDLISRAGKSLRAKLGASQLSPVEAAQVKATLPSNVDAARFYSEGLAKRRAFDNITARDLLQKAVAADPTFPLSHAALSSAWKSLGYDANARNEAKEAFDFSGSLSEDNRLRVEAQYRLRTHEMEKAVDIYGALIQAHPDDLEDGLALAGVQTFMGNGKQAVETLAALRKLPPPASDDPRIDWQEIWTTDGLGDYQRVLDLATKGAEKARKQGADFVAADDLQEECYALGRLGQPEKAIAVCEESQRIFAGVGDRDAAAKAMVNIATVLYNEGRYAAAKSKYEQALSIFEAVGDLTQVAYTSGDIANVLSSTGDYRSAVKMHERTVATLLETGDTPGVTVGYLNIGLALEALGDLAGAESKDKEALAIARTNGDKARQSFALVNLSVVAYDRGDLPAVEDLCNQLESVLHETGQKNIMRTLVQLRAGLQFARGDTKVAREEFRQAIALSEAIGDKHGAAQIGVGLANLDMEEGNFIDAQTLARQAMDDFLAQKDADDEIASHAVLARAFLLTGKMPESQHEIARMKPLVSETQNPTSRWEWLLASGRVESALGDSAQASADIHTVLNEASKNGFVPYQFEARLALGEIELKSGQTTAASAHLAALEKDATAKGFLLIARKAAAARK